MTEGQTDKWVGYTPLNHKHPYKQNANTYAYTHTQAHTHMHKHSSPQSRRRQPHIKTECATITIISINGHKTKIFFHKEMLTKKCNTCNRGFKKLKY